MLEKHHQNETYEMLILASCTLSPCVLEPLKPHNVAATCSLSIFLGQQRARGFTFTSWYFVRWSQIYSCQVKRTLRIAHLVLDPCEALFFFLNSIPKRQRGWRGDVGCGVGPPVVTLVVH